MSSSGKRGVQRGVDSVGKAISVKTRKVGHNESVLLTFNSPPRERVASRTVAGFEIFIDKNKTCSSLVLK